MKMYKGPATDLKRLRKQAEKSLPGRTAAIETMPSEDINKLIHELEVHQIELEIQNEELRDAQLELEAERNKYTDLYDFAPVGYLTLKEKAIIEQTNFTGAALLGIDRQSALGKPLTRFISREDQDTFYFHHTQVLKKNVKHTCEIKMMKYDKTPFYARLESIAVKGKAANFGKLRTALTDITERKLADQQLQAALEEKEVLLQEIHHRVKNNMQVVISLLNLQCEKIEDNKISEMFNKAVDRINSMALVHKQLYEAKNFSKVGITGYVESIIENLFISHGMNTNQIQFKIDDNDVSMSLESAINCGLIINELVTNSLKYAFPQDRKGEIRISCSYTGSGEVQLEVGDDGVGLPQNFAFGDSDTLGLQLVAALAEHQLGGSVNLDRTNGTRFLIRFKASS